MSRRDRIRARLIYDRRAILCNLLWKAPYGWISAYDARRWSDQSVVMGMDLASGSDRAAIVFHKGDKLTFLDVPVMDPAFEEKVESIIKRKQEIFDRLLLRIIRGEK